MTTRPLNMKINTLTRLAISIVFCTASVHAAGPAGKRFGGFAAKQTFSFKVEDRQSFESQGSATVQTFRIPASIPKFEVGQTVKFTIGRKGQLQGPGFSIPLELENTDYNQYLSTSTGKKPTPDTAILTKTSTDTPQQVVLYFYDAKWSGGSQSVTYVLK